MLNDTGAASDATALIAIGASQPSLELAVSVWLDAKSHKSESIRTLQAYRDTLDAFRRMLRSMVA